jgi:muconolactone delta-isomerase
MEFLVEFEVRIPAGTPESDVEERKSAEAASAARLADEGHLVRVWKRPGDSSADVLARLARGDDVDASEYTFRTSTQIETRAPDLDWLNKGVFISVAGRQPTGVVYDIYLVA